MGGGATIELGISFPVIPIPCNCSGRSDVDALKPPPRPPILCFYFILYLLIAAPASIKINFFSISFLCKTSKFMNALNACEKRQRVMSLDWCGELSDFMRFHVYMKY